MEQLEVFVDEEFLNIFKNLATSEDGAKTNLFTLPIKNKDFDYKPLIDELTNTIINFCISSKDYRYSYEKKRYGSLSKMAREKFREYAKLREKGTNYSTEHTKDGELGELILYSFLESHLEAPKILTKMRFKTSTNDAIKRSDGIHLLRGDKNYYELIYGESKLYKSLSGGISEAFKSIFEFKERKNNNIDDEFNFLVNNIGSEFTSNEYEYVKNILLPQENDIEYDVAFGIFVGFEIKIPSTIKQIKSREFKEKFEDYIKKQVYEQMGKIKHNIDKYNLHDYNFYIYLVPFTNLNDNKLKILEGILR